MTIQLDQIVAGVRVEGLVAGKAVRIRTAEPVGPDARNVLYEDDEGHIDEQLIFRSDESRLSLATTERPWGFDGDPASFKLGAEALRIQLAHLFDPLMAVHTSAVDPLPHQITAVYESMLPRQPLRFLLADDPGAGKTIMAGLFIRELMVRGDLKRCLIVAPGMLVEQWQDELDQKFGITFEIFSREMVERTSSGNPFEERDLLIARIDQLARGEDLQAKLEQGDWDLIIVDEAHKMSASYYGQELQKTKRYELGEKLGGLCRHLLLMTATPHNGKNEDFQAFMALIDSDRFYGKFRDCAHEVAVGDLMRRMVKEELLKFDGTPLFPPRFAHSVNYELSDLESALYSAVTNYVREEMNRAQNLDKGRKGTVGFALTILQRRLASSPEAIYQSLQRRSKKLEGMLAEVRLYKRGLSELGNLRRMTEEEVNNFDEDHPDDEAEEMEDEIVDQATAAQTIEELELEITSLKQLVAQARTVRQSRQDTKWRQLRDLLQDRPEMFEADRTTRRKIIIFTEHRDTLNYLYDRIVNLIGDESGVGVIHGGVKREERRKIQEEFTQNSTVSILLATDAAGEGVNLQRANLMINYDLPWNPNRLEQRFGRIHRIGQMEACHLWNLIAVGTREGDVFSRLLSKLSAESEQLDGKVFDVLGQVIDNRDLRDLLIEAIRRNDDPEVSEWMTKKIDAAFDPERVREILSRNALATDSMDAESVFAIREQMLRAEALKLQPFFIFSFFKEAFAVLGGSLKRREAGRFEITHVPSVVRSRDRQIGSGAPVLTRYQRLTFEKEHMRMRGKPLAALLSPGHPLMDSTVDLILEKSRPVLKQGCILVDRTDDGTAARLMVILDHSIRDGTVDSGGRPNVISRRLQYVYFNNDGSVSDGGQAPYLDLAAPSVEELSLLAEQREEPWLTMDLQKKAREHAVARLVPEHLTEVRDRRERHVEAVQKAVKERLTKEINHWMHRYETLKMQAEAGKQPRMQPENARRRAVELTERLEQRMAQLTRERKVISAMPQIAGGALVVPQGWIDRKLGRRVPPWSADADARKKIESAAMHAVIQSERALGHEPRDVSDRNLGWDIESRCGNGELRFIEVKGRAKGATTVTVTKNEILASLNQPDRYYLAIVIIDGTVVEGPHYIRKPFDQELDFGVTSVNIDVPQFIGVAEDQARYRS